MTDSRSPLTPNQIKKMKGAKLKAIVGNMRSAGKKRVERTGRIVDGARVSKVLKPLEVGDLVRFAIEHVRKTGANKRPYPKQRWSSKVYKVLRIIKPKIGFATYVLASLKTRRFEREDLQFVKRGGDLPSGDDSTAPDEAKRGSKRARRFVPV